MEKFNDSSSTQPKVAFVEESNTVDESDQWLSSSGYPVSTVDDVFGEISEGGPNYRAVGIQL